MRVINFAFELIILKLIKMVFLAGHTVAMKMIGKWKRNNWQSSYNIKK